jgi:tRNA threonylcarbamoyladenosine biosynthesis protein TsaB
MVIITIRTDKPEAELGLFEGNKQIAYDVWPAHRELSATIHKKLHELLESHGKQLEDIEGVVCFKGPGSFTGLRIGLTVGNTLAYGLSILIKGAMGDDWAMQGVTALLQGETDQQVMPEYGAEAHITQQKK